MAEGKPKKPTIYPAVPQYGPYTIRDLKPGEKKKWCTCGLSKKQPWCDDSHKCTGFTPLLWTVPENHKSFTKYAPANTQVNRRIATEPMSIFHAMSLNVRRIVHKRKGIATAQSFAQIVDLSLTSDWVSLVM